MRLRYARCCSEAENNMVWRFEEDFSVDDDLMAKMAKVGEQRKAQSTIKKLAIPENVERETETPIGQFYKNTAKLGSNSKNFQLLKGILFQSAYDISIKRFTMTHVNKHFPAFHMKVHDDDIDSPMKELPPQISEPSETPKFVDSPIEVKTTTALAMTSDDLDAWLGSDDHSPKSVSTVSYLNEN